MKVKTIYLCYVSIPPYCYVQSCRKLIKVTAHARRQPEMWRQNFCVNQTSKIIYSESNHRTEKRFPLSNLSFYTESDSVNSRVRYLIFLLLFGQQCFSNWQFFTYFVFSLFGQQFFSNPKFFNSFSVPGWYAHDQNIPGMVINRCHSGRSCLIGPPPPV